MKAINRVILILLISISLSSTATGDSIVLDDTMSVFDGEMHGSTGCNPELPLSDCRFFNRGGALTLKVGKGAAHISTVYRSLMGFDVSGLVSGSGLLLDSAILTLTVVDAVASDSTLMLGFQSLKYDVIEGNISGYAKPVDSSFTWMARILKNNADTVLWQQPGAAGNEDREDQYYAVESVYGEGTYSIDITALVEHWLDSTAAVRWCVISDTVSLAGGRAFARKEFWSSEAPDSAVRPKLELFLRGSDRRRRQTLSGGIIK
jgi:hypothetical protein